MNRNDEPVAVLPDVEDNKSIHAVGIGKGISQLKKASPSGLFHNPCPGADLLSSLAVGFRRLPQALDRDNMHCLSLLRILRSVNSRGQIR